MNSFLARAVAVLNGVIAVILIIAGAVVGVASQNAFGLIFGIIVGFVAALVLCGVLALVTEIHAELIRIRIALERTGGERPSASMTMPT
jgi:hypothetical protein